MQGITDAATHFQHHRLPEVFAGFDRREFSIPVHYPVACHPQAWAAGAVPFMVESALGLKPDAFEHRLHISQPVLPASVRELTLKNLRVSDATVNLALKRRNSGELRVERVHANGRLEVAIG
jgi:glycogen debranching enzyme